jgi:hypothetical protein
MSAISQSKKQTNNLLDYIDKNSALLESPSIDIYDKDSFLLDYYLTLNYSK